MGADILYHEFRRAYRVLWVLIFYIINVNEPNYTKNLERIITKRFVQSEECIFIFWICAHGLFRVVHPNYVILIRNSRAMS